MESSRPSVPAQSSYPYLKKLKAALQAADYSFESLQSLFPKTTLTGRDVARLEDYRSSIQESGDLAHRLAQLWLLREPLDRLSWNRVLGKPLVVEGLKHGLINGSALTHLEASFDLHPALGQIVMTDPKFRHSWENDQQGVYYLGSDSYALVHTVPREKLGKALDLFTGSGVHAVLAAQHAEQVTAVDINPRALGLTAANAAMNGVGDKLRCLRGDLWEPVEGETFDLITANPPFVPTPDQDLALYRSGGLGGEFLTSRLLARLHEFLNPDGLLAMVTNYPVFSGVDIVDHHRSMLGEPERFGVGLLHCYTFPREMYIGMHLPPSENPDRDEENRSRWRQSYEEQGIEGVGFGVLFFRHLEGGAPWSGRHDDVDLVHKPLGKEVSKWLRDLASSRETSP